MVNRLCQVAGKQGSNLPPEPPNWSRSAIFPVIESFLVYSQFCGECLLGEILPGSIPRERLRESSAVTSARWRIQPYSPKHQLAKWEQKPPLPPESNDIHKSLQSTRPFLSGVSREVGFKFLVSLRTTC
jgi:hypothetical protein